MLYLLFDSTKRAVAFTRPTWKAERVRANTTLPWPQRPRPPPQRPCRRPTCTEARPYHSLLTTSITTYIILRHRRLTTLPTTLWDSPSLTFTNGTRIPSTGKYIKMHWNNHSAHEFAI